MAAKPWYTSNDLIAAIKRKIMFPIAQATFTEDELLSFANEEMMISQVPNVLEFHEEYFVVTKVVPLQSNVDKYPIPDRAIGMKLRDLFWQDVNGNVFEMTRIAENDRAFFQRNVGANESIHKYYIQGNDIVLTPKPTSSPNGSLFFVYFLRPNQLVKDERAAIISAFTTAITLNNSSLVDGDTVTIGDQVFTARASSPSINEFLIGTTNVETATNLNGAINTNGVASANNGSPSTGIVTVAYPTLGLSFQTSNSSALILQSTQGIQFQSIPLNITNGALVDILQTKPGHKTYTYDIQLTSTAVSGNIITFNSSDVPMDLVIGDYVCLANECIIPQIPPDLHNSLAERTCARILSAIGDVEGLASANEKLKEIEIRTGTLLDNRVDGSPKRIVARHSLLRLGKMYSRRRF